MAKKRKRKALGQFPTKKKRFNKPPKRDTKSPQYVAWRKGVFDRDKRCCAWPGCKSTFFIQAHHIRRWADAPQIRYLVANGITLCCKHHEKVKNKEDQYAPMFLKVLEKQLAEKLNDVSKKKEPVTREELLDSINIVVEDE